MVILGQVWLSKGYIMNDFSVKIKLFFISPKLKIISGKICWSSNMFVWKPIFFNFMGMQGREKE